MSGEEEWVDFYEVLQVSANAQPDTIHRVYRMLAQRYHPDNQESGNEDLFRAALVAYGVLSDPEKRARYDVSYTAHQQDRIRLVSATGTIDNDFQKEQYIRLTVLEALYTKRRMEPDDPGILWLEFEKLTGQAREHLEFTLWFLIHKKFAVRGDSGRVAITVEGAEYLEQNFRATEQLKRLRDSNPDT